MNLLDIYRSGNPYRYQMSPAMSLYGRPIRYPGGTPGFTEGGGLPISPGDIYKRPIQYAGGTPWFHEGMGPQTPPQAGSPPKPLPPADQPPKPIGIPDYSVPQMRYSGGTPGFVEGGGYQPPAVAGYPKPFTPFRTA